MKIDRAHAAQQIRRHIPLLAVIAMFFGVCLLVQTVVGGTFAGASPYNSYTLQAMAWREGNVSLGRDYPHLELAVYEGDWYVSFPPVPSVPLYFLTFVFGLNTPDALMVKLYALVAVISIYVMLTRRRWNAWGAAFMALAMALGGSMLPLISAGAVWYQAQVMAFMFTTASVCLMFLGKITPSLLLYALAVGCRPFNVSYGLPLMLGFWLRQRDRSIPLTLRKMRWGIILGLCVAACYAVYNFARFGNPLEFGHNYLPEFVRSADGQFSLKYLVSNAKRFLLNPPFYKTEWGWEFEKFGCSVFLGNPMLVLMLVWYLTDLIRGKAKPLSHLIAGTFVIHLCLLLLHRTGGGFQLGARYAVDLVPYSLMYLGVKTDKRDVNCWESAWLTAGFVMMLIGSYFIHI